ncbi:hypothetical protein HY11_01545 [Hyphomonas pacifica]|nr:hypothetical protein HY11_01545 [Hyphomonas pacifica]
MLSNVSAHAVPKDLRRWAILRTTDLNELFSKVSLDADTETGIFARHDGSVSIVVTIVKDKCNLM